MKNRKREICTSGPVRVEDGNILIYSANVRGIVETSASFEARSAPRSYPTIAEMAVIRVQATQVIVS
jgi:hypothetical protein